MPCTVDRRERIRTLQALAATDERIVSVDVIDPHEDPTDLWTAELWLATEAGGVPPRLQDELATLELTVRNVEPRGLYWRAIVTV